MGTDIAAFDFDRTLTRRSTMGPFLRRLVGGPTLVRCAARAVFDSGWPPSRARIKESIVRNATRGRWFGDVVAVADRFADDVADGGLESASVRDLHAQQREGRRVVIVSSALEVYLRPAAQRLGVGEVIGSRLVVGSDGRCTGEVERSDLTGETKVRELLVHLFGSAERASAPDDFRLWAFGNSKDDEALLTLAHRTRNGRS